MALKRSDRREADKEDNDPLHDEEEEEDDYEDDEDVVNIYRYVAVWHTLYLRSDYFVYKETYQEKVQSFH